MKIRSGLGADQSRVRTGSLKPLVLDAPRRVAESGLAVIDPLCQDFSPTK